MRLQLQRMQSVLSSRPLSCYLLFITRLNAFQSEDVYFTNKNDEIIWTIASVTAVTSPQTTTGGSCRLSELSLEGSGAILSPGDSPTAQRERRLTEHGSEKRKDRKGEQRG